ncbi:MAG TPA: hypothetical protein VLI69_04435 [Gammaproteobacteria bacterium]|nr:hypothetical protein [Gammaproteobacteria bacterium]
MSSLDQSDKQKEIHSIIEDISKLDNPKFDQPKIPQLTDFIRTTINGDKPIAHLVLNINLDNQRRGIITYVLTNLRLIKIDIDPNKNEIESNSFPLNTIIGVERKLIDNDKTQFAISFQNGSIGLKYSLADTKITEFFQKID